ncbi:MAG: LPS assembly lipoprotein LptE [Candidatus Brocadiales bacterium]|nr:LPS assembly lipoprotein LptE [Candidatus Bathyanammoxibius amoris]
MIKRILIILVLFLAGCGYTSRSLIEQNVRSIYVPIFDNETFRRGLEFNLTRAIKEEILYRTQLKIVDKRHADTILTGKIKEVQENVLIENPDAVVVESRVTVTVVISWEDQRTGRFLMNNRAVSAAAEFIATRDEDVEFGEIEAFTDLAAKVVNLMERNW